MPRRKKPMAQRTTGLKQTTPLQRRTELGRGTKGLERATPIARKTELQRGAEPQKPSRAPVTAEEREARTLVKQRSHGWCEVQIPGICFGLAGNFHHRQNKSQLGIWSAPNGLAVCGSGSTGCHGALTNTNGRRREYERAGWIVPSTKNPAAVPVDHAARGRVLLLDNGDTRPAPRKKAA